MGRMGIIKDAENEETGRRLYGRTWKERGKRQGQADWRSRTA